MITIGVDFHKRTSSYSALDETGKRIRRCKLNNEPALIEAFLQSIPGEKHLAMEATRSWGLYYECVKEQIQTFSLGHPKKMKALTESEIKNDRNDAELIAQLAFMGFLPKAHVTTLKTRELRDLIRFRGFLVNARRSLKNHVSTLIDRNVWPCHRPQSFKNLFCKRGMAWLRSVELSENERFILDESILNYEHLQQRIAEIEACIVRQASDLPGLPWLRTVPGFKNSTVNAYCLLVETSDIHRFHKATGYAHYVGLIPRENSSAEKHRTGRLVKNANMHLRTVFIESTLAAIRTDKGLRAYYQQVKKRQNSGAAVIATARKLCYAVYHVLKEQRPYVSEAVLHPPAAVCHPSAVV
jgi:transposase